MISRGEFTRLAIASVLLFVLSAGRADAGKGATCVSSSGPVSNTGADGSTCSADVITSGKAKAKASQASNAESGVDSGGSADSIATGKSDSEATADNGCLEQGNRREKQQSECGRRRRGTATADASVAE